MASDKNPAGIRGTELTPEQLASASQFLALVGWKEQEPTRTTTRSNIARVVAWYGALSFQSGSHRIGSLEKPPRLVEITPSPKPPHPQAEELEFELIELVDVQMRPPGF